MPNRIVAGVFQFLESKLDAKTLAQKARALGCAVPTVHAYLNNETGTNLHGRRIARSLYNRGYLDGKKDATQQLLAVLIATFGKRTQKELADAAGVTQPTISNWLNGRSVPQRSKLKRLLKLYVMLLAEPIVEFERIKPIRSGNSWRLYPDADDEAELRDELRDRVGLYLFYDSAGRATYLGKTTNDLWVEVKQRLSAKVDRTFYGPALKKKAIRQGVVARYLSAYEVHAPAAIHNLEVLLLRAFPNDHANKNLGSFKNRVGKRS